MPTQTTIDLSPLSIENLRSELEGLKEELDEARGRVAQIKHDIRSVEEELARR